MTQNTHCSEIIYLYIQICTTTKKQYNTKTINNWIFQKALAKAVLRCCLTVLGGRSLEAATTRWIRPILRRGEGGGETLFPTETRQDKIRVKGQTIEQRKVKGQRLKDEVTCDIRQRCQRLPTRCCLGCTALTQRGFGVFSASQ